jgi:SAM-dependent methyltransferase
MTAKLCEDLIFDIGCNNGDDTDFYLRKGFRVVAVDADKEQCDAVCRRFSRAIEQSRLFIFHGAVADSVNDIITMHKFPEMTDWNTIDHYFKERNQRIGYRSVEIQVPVREKMSTIVSTRSLRPVANVSWSKSIAQGLVRVRGWPTILPELGLDPPLRCFGA